MKSRKGEMLIETVVAMTVFAIIMACSFAAYKSFSSMSNSTEDYINAEAICLDIDKYYDYYGKDHWAKNYFKNKYTPKEEGDEYYVQRFNKYYELTDTTDEDCAYEITYKYGDNNNLILSFKRVEYGFNKDGIYERSEKVIIKNLDYGVSLASSDSGDISYYEAIRTHNKVQRVKQEVDLGGETGE